MKTCSKYKILIATGGTGGHIFPAYSLAKNLSKNNYSVEIVTDQRGFKFLDKYKELKLTLNNSTTIFKKKIISSIFSIVVIFFSYLKSLIILYKAKPSVVFGMGGHASFPVCLAAKTLNIPFIIYENNLKLGKSNKYLLPFAFKIFVAYKDLEGVKNKHHQKVIVTGNIIREEMFSFVAKKNYLSEILNILVLGGSQAARSFGELLPKVFSQCVQENVKIKIFQQCVESQNNKLKNEYEASNIDFELFNFTDNILEYFSKADLVITRSGSSVTAELINCNIPFISIPYPYAADDHQEKNAIYFKRRGYCFLIKESEINEKLCPLIKSLYNDGELLNKIIEKQKTYSDKETFLKINNEIKSLINE